MKLFEAILDANHRAVAGDASAGLRPADFADSLPVAALTCIDPRLNAYFPNVLALPAEDFIWLRNAGNLVTGPLTSTVRSLALACAVEGAREIAVIGHTDCQICRTTTMVLLDKLKALGVDRARLPGNVNEFFATFSSERQNVIQACNFIRNSPIIGPGIPVHGLLLDLNTGKLDWVVNGYQTPASAAAAGLSASIAVPAAGGPMDSIGAFKDFAIGEMKFPEAKIGELAAHAGENLAGEAGRLGARIGQTVAPAAQVVEQAAAQVAHAAEQGWSTPPPIHLQPPPVPPKKVPLPPPIPPRPNLRRR
jgi:carbonic anhydrase